MKSTFRYITLCFALLVCNVSFAQDLHLSQYFSAPLYMNPALAGSIPHYRFSVLYRNQWTGYAPLQTNMASFDYNLSDIDGGIGFIGYNEKLPINSTTLTSTNASLIYAHKIRLGGWIAKGGLQLGFTSRNFDYSQLTFEDGLLSGTTRELIPSASLNFFDVGAGGLVYNETYWFGFSAYHLNKPTNTVLGGNEKLPMRMSFQAGAKLSLDGGENRVTVSPTLVYNRQASFNQLQLGAMWQNSSILLGAFFRGFPFQSLAKSPNRDALTLAAGYTSNGWTFVYSFDKTISKLNGSGGAHEISLSYTPDLGKRYTRSTKEIDCPISMKGGSKRRR